MKPLHYLILLFSLTFVGALILVFYIRSIISTGMPSLEQLQNPDQNVASVILSEDDKIIDNFYIQKRIALPYDSIPKNFINALVASEDRAYWDHWGVHTFRIVKAMVKNLLARDMYGEGASTISMQVARNMFLNHENSLTRKIREAATAVQIEKAYTKEDIIRMYANTVLFGKGAYGIQVAAQTYFGKNASKLTLGECAMLVGILPRPARYNPIQNFDLAKRRRDLVLAQMRDQGAISPAEYDEALTREIIVSDPQDKASTNFQLGKSIAPHFVEMIRKDLSEQRSMRKYDLYRDGLVIHTTLNSKIQKFANEAAKEHLSELQEKFNKNWNWNYHRDLLNDIIKEAIQKHPTYKNADNNGKKEISRKLRSDQNFIDSVKNLATTIQTSIVVIDPFTGSILAMVGASPKFMEEYDEAKYSLNHAVQIVRQPGSSFKPFVYSAALRNGWTPDDTIQCGPFEYELVTGDIWAPEGTGDCEPGGYVTLYNGLRRSINTVSARLITKATNPHEVIALVRKMGIETPFMAVPALALGAGGEVRPIDMTSAYGTFCYDGIHVEPYSVDYIEDKNKNLIKSRKKSLKIQSVMEKEIAYQMVYMMESVIRGGTAYQINNYFEGVDAAGKTGTTNDAADAWFIGYTPQLVCGVWCGFDDNRINFDPIGSAGYGGRAAAPIWGRLMNKIYSDKSMPYKQKQFNYKNPPDSVYKYNLPYPLTKKQEAYKSDKYIKYLDKYNKDSLKIQQSEPALAPLPDLDDN